MTPELDDVQLIATLTRELGAAGFDLVRAFRTVESSHTGGLSSEPAGRLAIVVGNTRALWPVFRQHLAEHPDALDSPQPLDDYTEQVLESRLARRAVGSRCYFAHAADPVPIQRVAELAGLAVVAPCRLSIHPRHGLWIALRAVVVLDLPTSLRPSVPPRPCDTCPKPCLPAFEHAALVSAASPGRQRVESHWRAWLAVRDSCPVGRQARYPNEQIDYHYTGNRKRLSG